MVQKKFIIGIDAGTQSSKVSIFDLEGNRICSASQALKPLHMPAPGVAEHPGDDLWDSIAAACRAAMQQFDQSPDTILGVGLCTIRCCRVVLNKQGQLAEPALNWMDTRLGDVYDWRNPRAHYVTTSSGYIGYRLTDVLRDTVANYEGQWPLDKLAWRWSDDHEVLARYGLPRESLFELVMPGDVLGEITARAAQQTGLPAGLPVVATANDKAVEALGAGLSNNDTALVSLGTYIGGMMLGSQHVEAPQHYFSNLACVPQRYLYECGGVRHGMGTVSWLRDLFGESLLNEAQQRGVSAEEILNQEAQHIAPGSEGLLTLPEWLAPYDQPHKRGAMIGFHLGHSRAHIYKSLLESIAMTMKNNLSAMSLEIDQSINAVMITGGGSNSDVFMQVFADVLGVPTRRNVICDAASLGSAMCVAVALGVVPSFDSAMQSMARPAASFAPNLENSLRYNELNQRVFKKLTQQTEPLLAELYSIVN